MNRKWSCHTDRPLEPPWPGATTRCVYPQTHPDDPRCAGCYREREQRYAEEANLSEEEIRRRMAEERAARMEGV